ncbi:MAG: T9SS type A sorting domain-containing protein [Melioribacteraceae bacterium]|nr:T9SS type A sorting domain-containing protein [Melioribacteraceae bacterium]MCF8356192.1 T9SS type A sorting domain-containing protein [Melioribacteraceae bacterium]MCF8394690.1 T9SS type A sorting domain-containing protein [Melioribacteraceae bacterium]MCF8420232.1 T9SS type A sorting domain-containing protein [Melioribacteraceae bacterium]
MKKYYKVFVNLTNMYSPINISKLPTTIIRQRPESVQRTKNWFGRQFLLILFLISFFFGSNLSAQWTALTSSFVFNTVFDNNGVLLAGTNGASMIWSTTDNGLNWTTPNTGMAGNTDVRAFASNPQYVFAGSANGGVYRSSNTGNYSWNPVLNISCYSLFVNGSDIFAGSFGNGIYHSSDNGTTWNQVNTGLTMLYVYSFISDGTYIFAGTYHYGTTPGGGVFRSSDNGQNWTQVNNGLTNPNIMSLAVKSGFLFAGTNGGGIFRSSDSGDNWTQLTTGVVHTLEVVCDTDIYAGLLSSGGVILSTDNGSSWISYNAGLPVTGGLTVTSLAASNSFIFAGTFGGIARAEIECIPTSEDEACITWDLQSSEAVTSTIGNITGQNEIISPGSTSPFMSVFDYNIGQRLWVGTSGWPINSIEDPTRFIEFNVSPQNGNNFTVSDVSFDYGDNPLSINFNILESQVYYSTDSWSSKILLNSSPLTYLNTAMQTFSATGLNEFIANGQTFSLRIYPYSPTGGIAGTPSFATHNNITICGTTSTEIQNTGSICGIKFNDLNGNGSKDSGEPGLPNWQIGLNCATHSPVFTDSLGYYCFDNLAPGNYTISEINQSGWIQTFPSSPGTYTVTISEGENISDLNFGNMQDSSTACVTWDLMGDESVTSTLGDVYGQNEIISQGSSSPFMTVYDYNNGQRLWVGTSGWPINSIEDPTRYIEFYASPQNGNNFTVSDVSFDYGDNPLSINFNILESQVYYSTDSWSSKTLLNSSPLTYLNTAMQTFSATGLNEFIANGQTFSLRIYPYSLTGGIVIAPSFATHNNITICGTTSPLVNIDGDDVHPDEYSLEQNYPNPFNPSTKIIYSIPKAGFVKITIYDILGREVGLLVNSEKKPGRYEVIFDAGELASGIYIYSIRTSEFYQNKKMILMK